MLIRPVFPRIRWRLRLGKVVILVVVEMIGVLVYFVGHLEVYLEVVHV